LASATGGAVTGAGDAAADQGVTGQETTGQGVTGQNTTGQDTTGHGVTGHGATGHGTTGQDVTDHGAVTDEAAGSGSARGAAVARRRTVPGGRRAAATERGREFVRRHRWFFGVLALGAVLRGLAMLGYRPAIWFPDSFTYIVTAVRPSPDLVRPAGYAMFLRSLEPFHSFAVVALVQHVLGLAMGVLVYTAARRLRAPGWAATLAAVPVLLDAYQIQLEHLLVSDTLFAFLVLAAVRLGLARRVGPGTACAIGLLVAAATLTRTVGLPLIVALGAWLLVRTGGSARRRAGIAGVAMAAALLPIIAYGGWFHATHQRIGIVGANGVFLYARTMSFADCSIMKPPPDLAVLCDPRPAEQRPPSQEYVWARDSPLVMLPDITFSEANDDLAGRFALLAIRHQPGDYLASALSELARTFTPHRPVYPDPEIYAHYEFPVETPPRPGRYPAQLGVELATQYAQGPIDTQVVEPFAVVLRGYQAVVRLPGTVLLAVLLVPPVAAGARLVSRRRSGSRRSQGTAEAPASALSRTPPSDPARGPAWVPPPTPARAPARAPAWVLPWLVAWMLLALPALVAEFDYRYVLPAVPLACLAAAVAIARPQLRKSDKE
jgi:hypothetical protein